jgi:BolA protein
MAESQRVTMIRERLTDALSPESIDIVDESHKHAGHEGARSGGGHFVVTIVSDAFRGKRPLERHRMVYDALGEAMNREIHALSIKAYASDEV